MASTTQVGRDFSAQTAKALPPAKLKQAWSALQQHTESFKSLGNLQPRTLRGQDVLVAPMIFTRMAAAALVVCDGNDHVISLRLVSASALPPATATTAK